MRGLTLVLLMVLVWTLAPMAKADWVAVFTLNQAFPKTSEPTAVLLVAMMMLLAARRLRRSSGPA